MNIEQGIRRKWHSVNYRCTYQKSYVRRGIRNEFKDYDQFREHALNTGFELGFHSHRKNKDLGYSPENLVWLSEEDHKIATAHERRRFSDEQALQIKAEYTPDNTSTYKLAKKYNTSQSTIYRMITGTTYSELN